ncbi:MAG TPA: 2OG-Fe(II) oxygenase [Chromatiaceae bacterium]|nr:2OG-Fe(II) oxygenase [Chromatiaceae bacterium]
MSKQASPQSQLSTIKEIKENSFVFEKQQALPADLCEEMIRRFEQKQDQQYQGLVGQLQNKDQSIKQSTDIALSGKDDWKDIDRALFQSMGQAILEFREAYPYFKGSFKDMGYAIQRTDPGQFYHWHIDGGSHSFSQRQLVALWYLNDVPGPGGETEFLLQDISVQPERGKLILFPPFWTHEHRGATLEKGVKYIATTWVVFA